VAVQVTAVIEQQFGSFDQFKQQFTDAAASLFGSGWTWLVKDASGNLSIQQAGTPFGDGATPLPTCDAWEHAHYID
jgi:Fe-Mn family superoxide dismutase